MTDEEKKADWKNRELGALWKETSSSGLQYYKGHVKINGEVFKLVAYANSNKKNEKEPDVRVYKESPKKENSGNSGGFDD